MDLDIEQERKELLTEKVRDKYGDEVARKLTDLLKSSGGMSASQQLSIDAKTVFVILASCALLIGKDPADVDVIQIAQTAFSLSNRLFNPVGSLNE